MSVDFGVNDTKTQEAMKNPKVGDRFSEMFSFYVYVIGLDGNMITTLEASPPCEVPKDGEVKTSTLEQFRKRFAYDSIPGYWIRYVDGGHDVEGWADVGKRVETDIEEDKKAISEIEALNQNLLEMNLMAENDRLRKWAKKAHGLLSFVDDCGGDNGGIRESISKCVKEYKELTS